MGWISTEEAAQRLGVSERRVRALAGEGRMRAKKIGRDWVIDDTMPVERREAGFPMKRVSLAAK